MGPGNYFSPTLITDADNGMRVAREEIDASVKTGRKLRLRSYSHDD